MLDTPGIAAQKRDYYIQMMRKAQELDDQILVKLLSMKLARLGITGAVSTASGCSIIPFPTLHGSPKAAEYERPGLWLLIKLTLAIPGSLIALLMLAHYST